MWLNVVILALRTVMFHGGRCPAGGVVEKVEKNENVVLSFSVNATKRPTAVRKKRKTRVTGQLAPHFWRLSLGNSYTLAKAMCARDTSRPAGSRARGEGRERGNLPVTTAKPPVAQRAGGIVLRGFLKGPLVGDLSADVAQCGYFGTKNGHVSWGPMPGRRRS